MNKQTLLETGLRALESVRLAASAAVAAETDSAAMLDITIAAITGAEGILSVFNQLRDSGQDILPGQDNVKNPKRAWDRLWNRVQNAAKRRGYRIVLRFSKKLDCYLSLSVDKIENIGADTDPGKPNIVAATPLTVSGARDRLLAICTEHGLAISEVIVAVVNVAGAGVQSAVAAHLSTPLAPLAPSASLPPVDQSVDVTKAGIKYRGKRSA
jgi:hypothetical protein